MACAVRINPRPLVGDFRAVTRMFSEQFFSSPHLSLRRETDPPEQDFSISASFKGGDFFLMRTSCSFPTSPDPKEHIFFCLSIPLVTVLAAIVSCSFPVEGKHLAQTVRVLLLAHIRRFCTSQTRSVNNQKVPKPSKRKGAIMSNTASSPKAEKFVFDQVKQTTMYGFVCISCPTPRP